jgi:hypothetical protein
MRRIFFTAFVAVSLITGAGALLTACALLPPSTRSDISNFFAGLANKATGDLQAEVATASTPAPNLPGGVVDQAGAQCGTALLAVQSQINQVLANANVASAGAVTTAEVATLLLPGTPQTNAMRDAIVAGCAVKVAQVTQSVAGGAVWFSQLAALFAIPLAPLGA